jgi:hypothetical protein
MNQLWMNAKHEIDRLSRRNEVLEAQVHVVEAFSAALFGPPRSSGATIDVAWELQKKIDELNAAPPA